MSKFSNRKSSFLLRNRITPSHGRRFFLVAWPEPAFNRGDEVDQTLECLIRLQKSDLDRIAHMKSRDELKLRLQQLEGLLERGHRELTDKQDKLSSAESFYREKSLELKAEVEKAVKTPPKKKPNVKTAKAARTSLKARARKK